MAYYTDEQRKERLYREYDYFRFETRNDLSGGIKVTQVSNCGDQFAEKLAADTAIFISYFMLFHYPHLNGFSGMDTVRWEIIKL